MLDYIQQHLPLQLVLVVAASFLIGLEMEERKAGGKQFSPGGVRTFPLICLAGFLLANLGGPGQAAFIAGLAVLGVWMALLYRAKVAAGNYGMTTEAYALMTYILGGLAAAQLWWLVAALTVLMVLLQELKGPLERLATRLPPNELATVARFVLLTAVILPLMPNRPYTRFELNPQRIWLVVVAVAGVSYAGYVVQRLTRQARGGLLLTGLLGGAYSSTATTVVLARRARSADRGAFSRAAFVGAILAAGGVMYLRLIVLIGIFDAALMRQVFWPLVLPAVAGIIAGVAVCLRVGPGESVAGAGPAAAAPGPPAPVAAPRVSPLELRTAFAFAAVFIVVLSLTHLAIGWLGNRGLYGLAMLSGLADVDPFVLSLTQTTSVRGLPGAGALAIVLTAAANQLAKGAYAAALGGRRAGMPALAALAGLGLLALAGWGVFLRLGWTASPW